MTPFRSAAFRWLWASSLASAAAQWMERTATAWLALEAGGGAFGVGLTFAARMLPSLLFGLIAGTLADRVDRRRQLVAVGGAGVVVAATLAGLAATGTLALGVVVAISFAAGCLSVFDMPARQALVLDSVGDDEVARAVALNALAARLFGALGAFASGALIPLLGVAACYLVVAALSGLGAALIVAVRVRRVRHAVVVPPPFGQALRDAARLIVDLPAVRTLWLVGMAAEVFAFSFMSAMPVLARDVLGAGAAGLGLLNGAAAIGGTLAVVLLALLPGRLRREPVLATVYLLYGLSILLLATTRDLVMAATVLVLTGACAAAFDALEQTLIQLAVPAEQRGRAVGVWVLGLGSAPVGHLEMGALTAALGAPSALTINGLLVLAGAAVLVTRMPAYRWTVNRERRSGSKGEASDT